jgi:ABC-type glycerol-3-phosphate transport system permease component
MSSQKPWQLILIYAVIALLGVFYIFPIYWALITSFKKLPEMMASNPTLFPNEFTLAHYQAVLFKSKYFVFLKNSLFVGGLSTALTLILSAGAGYAVSRLRFYGKGIYSIAILTVYLFPGILLVIPLFRVMASFGLYDKIWSVILVHVLLSLPFSVWTLTTFYNSVPIELEDAARIDGASRIKALWMVYLPLIGPGLATVAIFSFVVSWNDFLFPAILLSSPKVQTIPVGIAGWTSTYAINWGQVTAASILTIIPVVFFFALVGRYFVHGIVAGAVKQ